MKYFNTSFLCILLLAVVGCATSPPSRFYLLSAPSLQPMVEQEHKQTKQVSLQVQVPDYLDRPQIMLREGTHRLSLSEMDRWAEPLSRMLTRTLAQHLASGPVPVQVNAPGAVREETRIWIQILRLDGKPGDRVTLEANWQISPSDNINRVHSFSATAPASGQGMGGLVQAHEQLVQELASVLTQALQREFGGSKEANP
ncbi:MAG: PqiC family protein [Desulfovermiculus sp.]|nr:PqiC family protein [Desulfovermiculus sp.]